MVSCKIGVLSKSSKAGERKPEKVTKETTLVVANGEKQAVGVRDEVEELEKQVGEELEHDVEHERED